MIQLSRNKTKYMFLLLYFYIVASIIFPASDNYGSTNEYGFKRVIPQFLSVLIIAYSILELNGILSFKNKAIKSFYIFGIYTFLNFLFYASIKSNTPLYFLADELKILFWILPMYFFYKLFLGINREALLIYIRIYIILFILYVIIASFQEYSFRASAQIELLTEGQGVYTGGNIVFLLPLIFIAFQGRIKSYLFVLALGVAILTAKRTPILMIAVFGLIQLRTIFYSLNKKDYILLTVIILIAFSLFLSSYWEMLVERNQSDINRGNSYGSGREIFYLIVIKDLLNSNNLEMFFGHGFGSVQKLLLSKYGMAISSHNGFLDCVYVYGILGLFIYLSIFFRLIKSISYIARYTMFKGVYVGFVCMWIFQNLIVHGYSSPNMIGYSLFLAYIFSEANLNKFNQFRKLSKTI